MQNNRSLSEWLEYIQSVHHRTIDLELSRLRKVLQLILPQPPTYTIVSIGGTNGKGSTVAMLTSVLISAEVSVGSYTSPHLVDYHERFLISNTPVHDEEICAAFGVIESVRDDIPLTYFEYSTLVAFLLFAKHKVQVAIMEIGMGGRLDAVNAVDADVAILTNVAVDHQQWLGADRETIGREKAGIFREARPAIYSGSDSPLSIREAAASKGVDYLYLFGKDFWIEKADENWNWVSPDTSYRNLPFPALEGDYQLNNAAGAIMALVVLRERIPWTVQQLKAGLSAAYARGRFEVIAGAPQIIMDVAHNAAAAVCLAENLRTRPGVGKTLAVCGMLADKDISITAKSLVPLIDAWYLGSIHDERGADASELARQIEPVVSEGTLVDRCDSVIEAFRRAREAAGLDDRILVFGSFHTVGDIIRYLEL